MDEFTLDKVYKKGSKGKRVKMIQEWLSLGGLGLKIDGDFGPATDYAVREFQKREKLKVDGTVGKDAFGKLIEPMKKALKEISESNKSLGKMAVAYAKQHLKQCPREIGGQNKGPWVRLYMKGCEGEAWPWCAGFVSFILNQACDTLNVSLPLKTSFSCDILAMEAKNKNIFLKGSKALNREKIPPGSFFLERRELNDWTHIGIVVDAENEVFLTIEGNTNDEGSREGYEVCSRIRGYKDKDFIII
jgi:hypothetical protein